MMTIGETILAVIYKKTKEKVRHFGYKAWDLLQ